MQKEKNRGISSRTHRGRDVGVSPLQAGVDGRQSRGLPGPEPGSRTRTLPTLPHGHSRAASRSLAHTPRLPLPRSLSHSEPLAHSFPRLAHTLPLCLSPSRPASQWPRPPATKRRACGRAARRAGGGGTRSPRTHTQCCRCHRGTYQAGSLGPGAVLLLPLVFHVCISLRWFGGGERGEGGPGVGGGPGGVPHGQ